MKVNNRKRYDFNAATPVKKPTKESLPVEDSGRIQKSLEALASVNRGQVLNIDPIKFSPLPLNELRKKISSSMNKATSEFYAVHKTRSQIEDFELGKSIVKLVLDNSPENCSLTEEEYRKILDYTSKSNFSHTEIKTIFSKVEQDELFLELEDVAIEERPHDFINQIYYTQPSKSKPDLQKLQAAIRPRSIVLQTNMPVDDKTKDTLRTILLSSQDSILDGKPMIADKYSNERIYDLPLKYASAAYNTLIKNGSAYIENDFPEIFSGLDKYEVLKTLDLLSCYTRGNKQNGFPYGAELKFKIADKEFNCKALNRGMEGSVFEIYSQGKKPVILKNFYTDSDTSISGINFSPEGLYGGLAILQEANLAGVSNVPKLYLANPIFEPIEYNGKNFLGGWILVEDAKTSKVSDGFTLMDWLEDKGLIYFDNNMGSWVNGFCVDTGGIATAYQNSLFQAGKSNEAINTIYSKYLNNNSTRQIADNI